MPLPSRPAARTRPGAPGCSPEILLGTTADNIFLTWLGCLGTAFCLRQRRSGGLPILLMLGLLGTVLLALAARPALEPGLGGLDWSALLQAGARSDGPLLGLAFAFLLVGYGGVAGLAPLHGWMRGSEAVTLAIPFTNVGLLVLLRLQVLLAQNAAAIGAGPPLIVLGLVSVLLAAFTVWRREETGRFLGGIGLGQGGLAALAIGLGGAAGIFAGILQIGAADPFAHRLPPRAPARRDAGTQRGLALAAGAALIAGVRAAAGGRLRRPVPRRDGHARPRAAARDPACGRGGRLDRGPARRVLRALARCAGGDSDAGPRGGRGRLGASRPCPAARPRAAGRALRLGVGPVSALSIIQAGASEPARPWPRRVLTPGAWRDLAAALAGDAELALIGLWADTQQVHALFLHEFPYAPLAVSVPVTEGAYAALSPHRPASAWFERMVQDLWGHRAEGGTDARPWLDHGRWAAARPLSPRPAPTPAGTEPPEFLPAEDELHQLALGPVHGIIAPPGHFRLTLAGESVARMETRLGYAHRGQLTLMRGKSPRAAARYAARIAADATVAHGIAFARAAEAALDVTPPPRAAALRLLMAELERVATHLAALEALCAAAGAEREAGGFGLARERIARAAAQAFGHRMMMDCVVPGGLAMDIAPPGAAAILEAVASLALPAPPIARLAGAGVLSADLVRRFAAGGPVGRACGRRFDARLLAVAGDYQALDLAVAVEAAGDAAGRARLRLAEIAESARLVRTLLATLPEGPLTAALPMSSGEGFAVAESARGDVWHWLRLDGGLIAACFPCDPAWRHWPLLEHAMAGAALADFPLVAASLDCSVPGVDL